MKQMHPVRQSLLLSGCLLAVLFFLPLAVVSPFQEEPFEQPQPVEQQEERAAVSGAEDREIILRVLEGERVAEMDLHTYLKGVVRAEMPASFPAEALKAQAVAARTYTLHKLLSGGKHGTQADLCTDPACCQAYLGEEQARANWGAEADTCEANIENAVQATDGQAVLYGGTPILAVFHSSSAGLTRAAGEVWVNDLPYLQAVRSPEAGAEIPNYFSRAEFSEPDCRSRLLAAFPEADLSGPATGWLKNAVTDSAGSVETVEVGGLRVKGTQVRSALGLRSACFDWEAKDGRMIFYVTGYGHGVGLSQYGARQMAAEGADYREILTHYYTGVTVENYSAAFRQNGG